MNVDVIMYILFVIQDMQEGDMLCGRFGLHRAGAQLGKMRIDDHECWTVSAERYVVASVANVEEALGKKGLWLPTKCYTPMSTDYCPELDTSNELKSDGVQYQQELIGVLR